MSDSSGDFDDGWDAASEHGEDLEQWILRQENYSHPDYAGRDVDGRFNNKFGNSGSLIEDD